MQGDDVPAQPSAKRPALRTRQIIGIAALGLVPAMGVLSLVVRMALDRRSTVESAAAHDPASKADGREPAAQHAAVGPGLPTLARAAAPNRAQRSTIIAENGTHAAPVGSFWKGERPKKGEDIAAALESRFRADSAATSESQRTESVLRDALLHADGTALKSVECRSRTCRVEVAFADQATDRDLTRKLFTNPESPIPAHWGVVIPLRTTGPHGEVQATMYLVGPGKGPPRGG